MHGKWLTVMAFLAGIALVSSATAFASHGEKREATKAILISAFGTTVPEAQNALDKVDSSVKQAFPGVEVRWGYTSSIVRNKLAKQGKVLDSAEMALVKLMDEGFTHVAVLSLHTIPGEEFHNLLRNAHLFGQMEGGFDKVLAAWPLLSSHEDHVRVAKAMMRHIPAGRKPQDAVLLMGHGNAKHPSDAMYAAMSQIFSDIDPNVYVATVEGYPSIEDVMARLEAKKIKKVYLMPFMAVAGDHALNDMAGSDPDSWKSQLTKKGITCEAVMKGTAEHPEIVEVWLEHLKTVFAHFK